MNKMSMENCLRRTRSFDTMYLGEVFVQVEFAGERAIAGIPQFGSSEHSVTYQSLIVQGKNLTLTCLEKKWSMHFCNVVWTSHPGQQQSETESRLSDR